jgi:hypothetical protein
MRRFWGLFPAFRLVLDVLVVEPARRCIASTHGARSARATQSSSTKSFSKMAWLSTTDGFLFATRAALRYAEVNR